MRAVMDGFAAAAAAEAGDAAERDPQPDVSEALAADLAARKEGVRARLAQLQQVRCRALDPAAVLCNPSLAAALP